MIDSVAIVIMHSRSRNLSHSEPAGGGVDTVSQRRLHSLTVALSRLDALVAEQNAVIAGIREATAADPRPSYVQHTVHDTAHRLGPIDGSRTSNVTAT